MKIILSPIASNKTTTVSIDGLILTIDGVPVDLSVIPPGGQAIPEINSPFVGPVTREQVTIKYFYDSSKAESMQSMDWNDYTFEITSGEVPCPIIWRNNNV
jgi:hypothetical protein